MTAWSVGIIVIAALTTACSQDTANVTASTTAGPGQGEIPALLEIAEPDGTVLIQELSGEYRPGSRLSDLYGAEPWLGEMLRIHGWLDGAVAVFAEPDALIDDEVWIPGKQVFIVIELRFAEEESAVGFLDAIWVRAVEFTTGLEEQPPYPITTPGQDGRSIVLEDEAVAAAAWSADRTSGSS
jgi:hypothetical protein